MIVTVATRSGIARWKSEEGSEEKLGSVTWEEVKKEWKPNQTFILQTALALGDHFFSTFHRAAEPVLTEMGHMDDAVSSFIRVALTDLHLHCSWVPSFSLHFLLHSVRLAATSSAFPLSLSGMVSNSNLTCLVFVVRGGW